MELLKYQNKPLLRDVWPVDPNTSKIMTVTEVQKPSRNF